jgi:hypothetical protein
LLHKHFEGIIDECDFIAILHLQVHDRCPRDAFLKAGSLFLCGGNNVALGSVLGEVEKGEGGVAFHGSGKSMAGWKMAELINSSWPAVLGPLLGLGAET